MKFGKVLVQSMQVSTPAWEVAWFDYKLLKKIIKQCAQIVKKEERVDDKVVKTKVKPEAKEDNDSIRTSPNETNFFRTLRSEIKKIGDFFVKEQAAYISRVKDIEKQFNDLKENPEPEPKTEVMKSCVALYKELLLLENFAVMNFCGVSKILKKHDKWTGYATRNKFMRTILMKQPFATYLPLLQMIDRLEQIFMEATGCSIDQHSTRRPSANTSDIPARPIQRATSQDGQQSSSSTSDSSESGSGQPSLTRRVHSGDESAPDTRSRSPPGPVTLERVNAIRDNARLFEQTERMGYDGDDDNEEDNDDDDADGAFMGGSLPTTTTTQPVVQAERARSESGISPRENTVKKPARKGYSSDSNDADVAIAMMSMREGRLDASDSEGTVGSKRKAACSPMALLREGKRKMSFTTILN